jgi:hypothetical protein
VHDSYDALPRREVPDCPDCLAGQGCLFDVQEGLNVPVTEVMS